MRDLLDAAWGDFPTEDVGFDWARYTGAARPTAEWVAAIIRHSKLTFIQESYSTRSSEGYDVGVADCRYAEARAREVYPGYRGSIIVAVSDGNSADRWDSSEYGRGWSAAATLAFLPYGTPAICASFCAGAGANPLNLMGDMVPETWGTTSPPMSRLITQTVRASPVPNTDFDIVHADYTGAPAPAPVVEDDDMPWIAQLTALDGRKALRLVDGGRIIQDFGLAEVGAPFGVPASWVAWKGQDPSRDALKRVDVGPDAWDALAAGTVDVKLTDAQLKKIAAGVTVDYAAVAKAVNDDAAARLAKV